MLILVVNTTAYGEHKVQEIIYFKLFISFKVCEEFLAVFPVPYLVPKISRDPVHTAMQENNTKADSLINALH